MSDGLKSNTAVNHLLPKQLKLANILIKKSTEEIAFNADNIEDFMNTEEENQATVTSDSDKITDIIKLKSNVRNNSTSFDTNSTLPVNDTIWYVEYVHKMSELFWSVVPKEDILLAVIVPSIIIVSLIVFTIVTVCLLQMCNRDYEERKKSKKFSSFNNTNNMTGAHSIEKAARGVSSIYKERAYLSKGVPVILYEEMSDKPIDDYDENQRDIMDNGCETRNYRSPLIMRNEKPPTPAPPEYSRIDFPNRNATDKKCLDLFMKEESQVIINEKNEESVMLIVNKNKKQTGIITSVKNQAFFKPLDPINEDLK